MFDWCKDEVLGGYDGAVEQDKEKQKRIAEIEKELSGEFNTKQERRTRNKLITKLAFLRKSIGKKSSFGGKANLREITRLHNKLGNSTNKDEKEKLQKRLEVVLEKYHVKRQHGLFMVGRACEYGNRKVEFHLDQGFVIFKPSRGVRIRIEFRCTSKKMQRTLDKMQSMTDNKQIPVSVRLFANQIQLVYDEQRVAGFAFDETEFWKEKERREKHSKLTKEEFVALKRQFHLEQEARMLADKVSGRYMAVDLNPTGVGWVIADWNKETRQIEVIEKQFVEFSELSKHLGLGSHDPVQVRQNNRRINKICEVWKYLFGKAEHYRVSHFVSEDLDFKFKDKNYMEAATEFNRKRRNIWHLELTKNLITKYCNQLGLKHVPVIPAYSSFIGNMTYNDIDAIAAAKELLRRGVLKYEKGNSLFPGMNEINQEKLCNLLGEKSQASEFGSWKQLYKEIFSAKLRYRNVDLVNISNRNLNHSHGLVKVYADAIQQEVIPVGACV
jgi:hypothetical protein